MSAGVAGTPAPGAPGSPLVLRSVLAGPTGAVPVVRSPFPRIEFRSLLREDRFSRQPAAGLRPPTAAAPGAVQGGSASPGAGAATRTMTGSLDSSLAPHAAGDSAGDAALVPREPRDRDALDPFARHHAAIGPPESLRSAATAAFPPEPLVTVGGTPAAEAPRVAAAASLEELLPEVVRRVAFSGDGRRGTMRLEIGAGRFAGSTLLVHADGGRVRVHLEVADGVDAAGLASRLAERLRQRGIAADAVEVT